MYLPFGTFTDLVPILKRSLVSQVTFLDQSQGSSVIVTQQHVFNWGLGNLIRIIPILSSSYYSCISRGRTRRLWEVK